MDHNYFSKSVAHIFHLPRPFTESVLRPSTSGMSAALMQGHCLRRRPDTKRHMSGGRECHRKYHRNLPPHLTRHKTLHAPGWINVEPASQTVGQH